MLVVTRKPGEVIVIGDPASPLGTVKVVEIHEFRASIGLDFPRHIRVHRAEIAAAIANGAESKRPAFVNFPMPPKAVVNIQVSDTDPLMALFDRLGKLYERLERGEILTVDEARQELGRILTLNEGERLG